MTGSLLSQLLEVFGTGTAAVISPVSFIKYRGKDIEVRLDGGAFVVAILGWAVHCCMDGYLRGVLHGGDGLLHVANRVI